MNIKACDIQDNGCTIICDILKYNKSIKLLHLGSKLILN
jgi:hypothetical protein